MICPFAIQKLIPPGANDPRINARVVILHVAVSKAKSLFRYFNGPSGGIESHFYIRWFGKIEQYRDTDFEADANYLANPFAVSIETAGFGSGKWNRRQMASIKRLLLWLHEAENIQLQRCPTWDGSGVGYHVMYGAPGKWTNVAKSCPGPARIKQFEDEIVPWMRTAVIASPPPIPLPKIRAKLRRTRRRAIHSPRKAWLTTIIRAIRKGPKG